MLFFQRAQLKRELVELVVCDFWRILVEVQVVMLFKKCFEFFYPFFYILFIQIFTLKETVVFYGTVSFQFQYASV